MKTLEIFTDGSCKVATKNKNGTCAFIVVDKQKVIHKESYKYEDTTNNRMELMGCTKALEWIDKQTDIGRVYIHTDSQYVQLGLTEWLETWKKKNWRTAQKKDVVNQDLWKELDRLKRKLPMVQFQWVRGHNNNKFNELADKLCTDAYSQLSEEEKERTVQAKGVPLTVEQMTLELLEREQLRSSRVVKSPNTFLENMYQVEVDAADTNAENLIKATMQLKEADQLLLDVYREMWKERIISERSHGLRTNVAEYLMKKGLIEQSPIEHQ